MLNYHQSGFQLYIYNREGETMIQRLDPPPEKYNDVKHKRNAMY